MASLGTCTKLIDAHKATHAGSKMTATQTCRTSTPHSSLTTATSAHLRNLYRTCQRLPKVHQGFVHDSRDVSKACISDLHVPLVKKNAICMSTLAVVYATTPVGYLYDNGHKRVEINNQSTPAPNSPTHLSEVLEGEAPRRAKRASLPPLGTTPPPPPGKVSP